MRAIRLLPLLAVVSLPGCDGTGEWLRGPAAAAAYAAPLAGDTAMVTTRRVWSSGSGSTVSLDMGTVMPYGAGVAITDWDYGDPAILDLASRELRRFRVNDEPYDTGLAMYPLASPDGGRIAYTWWRAPNDPAQHTYLRTVDIATGESSTLLATDTTRYIHIIPAAWTPAGDSLFALLLSERRGGDEEVVLIPASGGTARPVHTIPLSASSGERNMSLSPDGRWLLYTHHHPRAEPSRSDIYIIDVQGGGARPLVEHPATDQLVGWLPGTDVVLFSSDRSGTTDLWSVRVAAGGASAEPRMVRSGFFRSSAIGFGGGALFYMVSTGSGGTAFTNLDPHSGAPLGAVSPVLAGFERASPLGHAWSPDGETLAAITITYNVRTLTLRSMKTGASRLFWLDDVMPLSVQWAANGRALFLAGIEEGSHPPIAPVHFVRLDLVSGAVTRLFDTVEPGRFALWGHRFRVTPDGRSIVLLRPLGNLDDDQAGMMLVLRSLENGSERELHRTSGFVPEFSVSPDGTRLAFIQQAWKNSNSLFLSDSLFVLSMDGSQSLRFVAGWDQAVSLLGWLPAGNALLAARLTEDGKAEELLRIELDGATTAVGISPFQPQHRGSVPGAPRSRLVLSPAGNRLAHWVSDPGEELWRMDGLHELFARDAPGRR